MTILRHIRWAIVVSSVVWVVGADGSAEAIELTPEDFRMVVADYFAKEAHVPPVVEVRMSDQVSGVVTLSGQDLHDLGFDPGCVRIRGTLTLSLAKRGASGPFELCAVVEGLDNTVWFYPIVRSGRQSQIVIEGRGEITTFVIRMDRSIWCQENDIGLGGVRAVTSGMSRMSENGIRVSVLVEPNTEPRLVELVVEEVLAGSPDATVLVRTSEMSRFAARPEENAEQNVGGNS